MSPTQILAIAPPGVTDGPIGVESPSGVRYSATDFVVSDPTPVNGVSWGHLKSLYRR